MHEAAPRARMNTMPRFPGRTAPRPPGIGEPTAHGSSGPGSQLRAYLNPLVHDWCQTLVILASTLVPIFFILDYFIMPGELLSRVALYRLTATVVTVGQYLVLRMTRPSRWSHLHGYVVSIVVGGVIALMTRDLGGFNSTYYAGLNLVMFATTILLPWEIHQAAANAFIIIGLYVGVNLAFPQPFDQPILINNLYFLSATAVISISISYVKQRLVKQEFWLREDLRAAHEALWGEMEFAKHIQTALLPNVLSIPGYNVAARMEPADEVGGDYYDIIRTQHGETWLSIGDVSGHGLESGLIMMLTQASIMAVVNRQPDQSPMEVLDAVNRVFRHDIARMQADRYMTLTVARIDDDAITVAGKHQDLLVYRHGTGGTQVIPTPGTWLGLVDDIREHLHPITVRIARGDLVLFFTDGLTEARNSAGELFGEDRAADTLNRYAGLPAEQILRQLFAAVHEHMAHQADDFTAIVLKRSGPSAA